MSIPQPSNVIASHHISDTTHFIAMNNTLHLHLAPWLMVMIFIGCTWQVMWRWLAITADGNKCERETEWWNSKKIRKRKKHVPKQANHFDTFTHVDGSVKFNNITMCFFLHISSVILCVSSCTRLPNNTNNVIHTHAREERWDGA